MLNINTKDNQTDCCTPSHTYPENKVEDIENTSEEVFATIVDITLPGIGRAVQMAVVGCCTHSG